MVGKPRPNGASILNNDVFRISGARRVAESLVEGVVETDGYFPTLESITEESEIGMARPAQSYPEGCSCD